MQLISHLLSSKSTVSSASPHPVAQMSWHSTPQMSWRCLCPQKKSCSQSTPLYLPWCPWNDSITWNRRSVGLTILYKWSWWAYWKAASKIVLLKWQLKEYSTPKNYNLLNMYSPTDHPIYRWVCCFIGSDLAKFNIASLAHQCHKFNQKCTLCDNLLTVMSQTNMLFGISSVGQNRTHLEESSHNSLPHNGGLYSIIVCLFHFMIANMNCCSMENKKNPLNIM